MTVLRWLRRKWNRSYTDFSETLSEDYVGERAPQGLRFTLIALLTGLLLLMILGWFWSNEPDQFDVWQIAGSTQAEQAVVGTATTTTLIHIVDILLHKSGGYLANDLTPPGLWLDNLPSWEFGVLVQIRDLSKALRESFSRSQSQSTEDPDLALAEPRFNVDHHSWAVPWPESEYADGRNYLQNYLMRLGDEQSYDAQFYARADNLRYWLGTVETRLGSLSQRLSASVGQRRINTDLVGSASAAQSTTTPAERLIKTDFAEVLANKNALASVRQIIRELEMTQQPVHAPMIFNGEGFGVLANHSLVMASYISRANAAIIDLRELLSKG